jgi:hypothetical protein
MQLNSGTFWERGRTWFLNGQHGSVDFLRGVRIYTYLRAGKANEAAQLESYATTTGAKISTSAPESRWSTA